MVTLKNFPSNKGIFQLHSLFNMTNKVETYKLNTQAQYFNCQKIGHSSLYYGLSPRCVKYTRQHKTIECTKTLEEKPNCTNYERSHTVNFKKCPAIPKMKAEKRLTRPVITKIPEKATTVPPTINSTVVQIKGTHKMFYVEATGGHLSMNFLPITEKLQELLVGITTGQIDIKDVLKATIIAILPLLLPQLPGRILKALRTATIFARQQNWHGSAERNTPDECYKT